MLKTAIRSNTRKAPKLKNTVFFAIVVIQFIAKAKYQKKL